MNIFKKLKQKIRNARNPLNSIQYRFYKGIAVPDAYDILTYIKEHSIIKPTQWGAIEGPIENQTDLWTYLSSFTTSIEELEQYCDNLDATKEPLLPTYVAGKYLKAEQDGESVKLLWSDIDSYTKSEIDTKLNDKISLLGNEAVSGEPYHFTYYIDTNLVGNDLTTTLYTITLDNNKTLQQYSKTITLPTGTNVVANPTLAGTEAELTGLQVGDIKYKVPEGSGGTTHLYQHNLSILYYNATSNKAIGVGLNIFLQNNTTITTSTIQSILENYFNNLSIERASFIQAYFSESGTKQFALYSKIVNGTAFNFITMSGGAEFTTFEGSNGWTLNNFDDQIIQLI